MKFSLGWRLVVAAVVVLCLGSYILIGHYEFHGMVISVFLFLSLSLRNVGGKIRAEPRAVKMFLNLLIGLVVTTVGIAALATGQAVYDQRIRQEVATITDPVEIAMIHLAVFGVIHFLVLLPVAFVVWCIGHLQQRRSEAAGSEESSGE